MKNREIKESFKSQKSECTYIMKIDAPASTVFPLLCPIKEYDWIDGWKCDLLYSKSGFAEYLCVFKTTISPFGDETWVCTRYEPDSVIQYTRFSNDAIVILDITCIDDYSTYTSWSWTLSALGLNDTGNKLVESFIQEVQIKNLAGIGFMLNHYIKTGVKLIL